MCVRAVRLRAGLLTAGVRSTANGTVLALLVLLLLSGRRQQRGCPGGERGAWGRALPAAVSPGPGQAAGVTVSSLAQGRKKLINVEGISGPEHPAL